MQAIVKHTFLISNLSQFSTVTYRGKGAMTQNQLIKVWKGQTSKYSKSFFFQSIGIAIQGGNALCHGNYWINGKTRRIELSITNFTYNILTQWCASHLLKYLISSFCLLPQIYMVQFKKNSLTYFFNTTWRHLNTLTWVSEKNDDDGSSKAKQPAS
jgi:hypothetical protein